MTKKELRKWLLDNAFKKDGNAINSRMLNKHPDILSAIYKYTDFLENATTARRVYAILEYRVSPYRCVECGNIFDYKEKRPTIYCSPKCVHKSPINKRKSITQKYITDEKDVNIDLRDWLLKYAFTKSGNGILSKIFDIIDPAVQSKLIELENCTSFFDKHVPISTRIYAYLNGQTRLIRCVICGREIPPDDKGQQKVICSKVCATRLKQNDKIDQHEPEKVRSSNKVISTPNYGKNIGGSLIYHPDIAILTKDFFDCEVIFNSRKIIPPYKLDIYLPEYNLAIEYEGHHWPLERDSKDKNYRLNKTLLCAKENVQLFHIFNADDSNIWKSIINRKLNRHISTIYADDTLLKLIDNRQAQYFCDKNNLDGRAEARWNLGLYHKDKLVEVMCFDKSKGKYDFELLRFCTILNTQIIGGADKLFKKFLDMQTGTVMVRANLRWTNGNLYESLGFHFEYLSAPRCLSTNPIISKNNSCQQIWDCGHLIYLWEE